MTIQLANAGAAANQFHMVGSLATNTGSCCLSRYGWRSFQHMASGHGKRMQKTSSRPTRFGKMPACGTLALQKRIGRSFAPDSVARIAAIGIRRTACA